MGTPATRASIIENIVKKGFVERNKKQIISTEVGRNLIKVLPDTVTSPKLTADWETRLQAIEKGKERAEDFMTDIETYIRDTVAEYSYKADNSVLNSERKTLGICPKCGRNVIEMPKSYSCESGRDECGFIIWKSISGKAITEATAKELLQNRKTGLIKGFENKDKKSFDAYLKLDDNNKVVFEFEKQSDTSIGNCPKCGNKVTKGKFGYYCTGKCGMQLAKVYGKELTETQLSKLLSGNSITYTNNKKTTTVLPEIEEYSFNGKSGFQWKTKKA